MLNREERVEGGEKIQLTMSQHTNSGLKMGGNGRTIGQAAFSYVPGRRWKKFSGTVALVELSFYLHQNPPGFSCAVGIDIERTSFIDSLDFDDKRIGWDWLYCRRETLQRRGRQSAVTHTDPGAIDSEVPSFRVRDTRTPDLGRRRSLDVDLHLERFSPHFPQGEVSTNLHMLAGVEGSGETVT